MRRFITSLQGKVISQVVILALLLPSITLALFVKANAQVASLPQWAVTEFKNDKSPGTGFGKTAATAVESELGKSGQYDVLPDETVARAATNLGIALPADNSTNLMRLAQDLHADTVVSGEIKDYRILSVSGGRQATVALLVTVYDVASGLAVNGSAISGVSTVRSGSVSDETLVNDAITQAAGQAMRDIKSRTLPVGTVLNTQQNKALINKGNRSGFQSGQEVVVIRGRDQVATAKVTDVEPDSSYIVASRLIRGIQPGDKVRVIFRPPDIYVAANGDTHVIKPRNTSFPSGLVSVLLVLGVAVALVGSGNGGSQGTVEGVQAQAGLLPNTATGQPIVYVTWSPTVFSGGQSQQAGFQIYRSDVQTTPPTPVWVVVGNTHNFSDTETQRAAGAIQYAFFGGAIGGNTCNFSSISDTSNLAAVPGVSPGTAYSYQVQEVYEVLSIDLPNGGTSQTGGSSASGGGLSASSGGNTGGIGGGNTGGVGGGNTGGVGCGNTGGIGGGNGGGNTGGNTSNTTGNTANTGGTGNTSGSGGQECFFVSAPVTSIGFATPLNPPSLVAPSNNATLSGTTATNFTVNSAQVNSSINVEYLLEMSTTPNFAKGTFVRAAKFQSNLGGVVGPANGVNPATFFPNAPANTKIFWRYGARNTFDKPGPIGDSLTGEHYIFSNFNSFTFTGTPPPPPSRAKGTKIIKHTGVIIRGKA